jgi:hypothetical protein
MSNRFRQEVTFHLDGIDIPCRPTLAKIGEIETAFGPVATIFKRMTENSWGIGEQCRLVAIIVRGCPGAPKPQQAQDLVYNAGCWTFLEPVVAYLNAAQDSGERVPAEAAAGN